MSQELSMILKDSRISATKPRLFILKSFLQEEGPLDLHYFLHQHANKFERTTVFRTLKLFMEKKIIYSVHAGGVNKYFLYQREKNGTTQVHYTFICTHCGKTIPLENTLHLKIKMPKGFKEENLEVIIHGECGSCKN
jgi:Fur family ferric uptake transcriptional regulator